MVGPREPHAPSSAGRCTFRRASVDACRGAHELGPRCAPGSFTGASRGRAVRGRPCRRPASFAGTPENARDRGAHIVGGSSAHRDSHGPRARYAQRSRSLPCPRRQNDALVRARAWSSAPASTSTPAASHASPEVDEEVRLVGLAYSLLRDGAPARALAVLEEHERRFPDGKLTELRKVTRVLALCQSGRVADARTERDRFLSLYPRSPYSNRVRSACSDPSSP